MHRTLIFFRADSGVLSPPKHFAMTHCPSFGPSTITQLNTHLRFSPNKCRPPRSCHPPSPRRPRSAKPVQQVLLWSTLVLVTWAWKVTVPSARCFFVDSSPLRLYLTLLGSCLSTHFQRISPPSGPASSSNRQNDRQERKEPIPLAGLALGD